MLYITKGKILRPLKVVVYGSEGIGKTTFAAQFPDPLFIDTEDGTAHLDVRRVKKPESWDELITIVGEVAEDPKVCKTLVIDTADWAEVLCVTHVCKKYKQNSIESFGYGKGYTYLAEEFNRLLAALDKVIESGKNVVITAHAKMRKFEQPDEQGAYDRWEMKLSKQVAPLLKEWCDTLLFLNYKTYVVTTENNTKKAQGGKRVVYTTHHPCWDAKNRQGLPEEMDLDFENIAHLFMEKQEEFETGAPKQPKVETPLEEFQGMMKKDGIKESEVRRVVADRGRYPLETPIEEYPAKFVKGWLIKYWPNILTAINENRDKNN